MESHLHFGSETWAALDKHMRSQLQLEREKNDGRERDAIQTAIIRGRISMLKELLALPEMYAQESQANDVEPA